jgi:hypothetical protein
MKRTRMRPEEVPPFEESASFLIPLAKLTEIDIQTPPEYGLQADTRPGHPSWHISRTEAGSPYFT